MTAHASLSDLWPLLPVYAGIFSLFAWKSGSGARRKHRLAISIREIQHANGRE